MKSSRLIHVQRPICQPTNLLPAVCPASEFSSSLINIPAPNTATRQESAAHCARNLFDASLGKDNIFHKERFKTNLDFTAINVTNKYALYNFLSHLAARTM